MNYDRFLNPRVVAVPPSGIRRFFDLAATMKDGAFRMAKTGAAMSIGGAVTAAAGFWAALPVTMGVRAMFDRYRSKALTNHRVQGRIDRLRELRELMAKQKNPEEETSKAETVVAVSGVVG